MRPWPRAAAAAAFIFKLLSGQRARRGRGSPPSRQPHPWPPRGCLASLRLSLAWLPAYLRVRPGRAPHAGRSPWLWRQWRFWGVSAAAAAAARGQDGGPAAHPARPARRATTYRRLRSVWERSKLVAREAMSGRLFGVGPPQPRSCSFAPRRPSPGRGPTLLYSPGWAWPLRTYQGTKCAGDAHPRRDGVRSHHRHNQRASTPPCSAPQVTTLCSSCTRGRADAELGDRCRLRCLPLRPCDGTRRAPEDYVGSSRVTHWNWGSGERGWDPPFPPWMLEASASSLNSLPSLLRTKSS